VFLVSFSFQNNNHSRKISKNSRKINLNLIGMVNVFCTRKTESIITVEKKRENYNQSDENWLCNLIAVGGKNLYTSLIKRHFIRF
jgi:hypothetical protein